MQDMSQQLIKAFSNAPVFEEHSENYLEVSEFFTDTIQGEGVYTGHPATFLRLKGCTLNCNWCDSKEVWRTGHKYSFRYLFQLLEDYQVIEKLEEGQHLVITGGSPLLQQNRLYAFILAFQDTYEFTPFIELENEAVLSPSLGMISVVDCWNNSPKLRSSKNVGYFKWEILHEMGDLSNSWFKFVITSENDWKEIQANFIDSELIRKDQIILMPEGATREALQKNTAMVVELAIKYNVRYSGREHITLWNEKTGV